MRHVVNLAVCFQLKAAIHRWMGQTEQLTQQTAAFHTNGCEVNIVKPVLCQRRVVREVNVSCVLAALNRCFSRWFAAVKIHGNNSRIICQDSHQKRWALLRPESPTSELLLRPDAVFPSEREKKHRLLLLCGFRVVVATFWSSVSLISAGLSLPAAWLCLRVIKVSVTVEKRKRRTCFFGWRDHGSVRDDGDYWLIWVCPLPADAACLPPHSRVIQMSAGKQRHPTEGAGRDRVADNAAPQCPLLEKMLQWYKFTSTYKICDINEERVFLKRIIQLSTFTMHSYLT